MGRVITPDDARPGAPPVFVLAHKMWLSHLSDCLFNVNVISIVIKTGTACPSRVAA